MFTGIIERTGAVRAVVDHAAGRRLTIAADAGYWGELPAGASVAIDGVCLTLTDRDGKAATFDVISETLRRTTLGDLAIGGLVNLERALAAGARLDGHFVQGHVDAVGRIERVERSDRDARWFFRVDAATTKYIVPKGGIAIDGISLTIAETAPPVFAVALIPTTLERTTLGAKRTGDRVNIETDILARTVVHAIESMAGGGEPLTLASLRRSGFA